MLAPLPRLNLKGGGLLDFPPAFSAFYNDRFAFRQEFVSLINYFSYKAFAVSTSPAVAVGHHGWLFFIDHGDEETAMHYPLFTKAELRHWVHMLEARRAWLAARNIKFLFFVAPSKCSIYSEALPPAYRPNAVLSRQDQLLSSLRANSRVSVIDLRKPLIDAKKFTRLYYQTDTHWNPVGAYLAYLKIADCLKKWFPQIRPCSLADVAIDTFKFEDGDLQNMMGLHALIPEIVPRSLLRRQPTWEIKKISSKGQLDVAHAELAPYATEIAKSKLPRAFCLRDSFMASMEPFLSTHFSRVAYYWQQEFPVSIIEREKPDVVIEEIVERELYRFDPHNPPTVDQGLDREYFARIADRNKLAGTSAIKIQ